MRIEWPLIYKWNIEMAVYTCNDMVHDCRARRPEGWRHFIAEYLPFCRAVILHYLPERGDDPNSLPALMAIFSRSGCTVFEVSGIATEREFLLGLRDMVIEQFAPRVQNRPAPESALLTGVPALERQIGWLEAMGYDEHASARMLNLDHKTVAAVRAKLNAALQGAGLSCIVLPAAGPGCASARTLADYSDGRLVWQTRQKVERHLCECWRCVDLFCRLRESDFLMSRRQPLKPAEVENIYEAMDIKPPPAGFWRKVFSAGWS